MFKKIETPAACEIRSVIRFLNAKNMKPAEIHRQLCDVYGEQAMSSSMVRRWVRLFNEGRENVHDDPRSGRPSMGCNVKKTTITPVHTERHTSTECKPSIYNSPLFIVSPIRTRCISFT